MSIATIRSVSNGIVAVAIIQALLPGMSLVCMNVPAASICAASGLLLAVGFTVVTDRMALRAPAETEPD